MIFTSKMVVCLTNVLHILHFFAVYISSNIFLLKSFLILLIFLKCLFVMFLLFLSCQGFQFVFDSSMIFSIFLQFLTLCSHCEIILYLAYLLRLYFSYNTVIFINLKFKNVNNYSIYIYLFTL